MTSRTRGGTSYASPILPSTSIIHPPVTMTFLLNPYDTDLDLRDKADRKMFTDGCQGLSTEAKFNGEREKINDFLKLIGQKLNTICSKSVFNVALEYSNPLTPMPVKILNLYDQGLIDDFDKVTDQVNLVWADTTLTNTPKFFDKFDAPPTTDDELNTLRNQRRLRHVMAGKALWNSFTSVFQLELAGSEDEFTKNGEIDGLLLFYFFIEQTNPTTIVELSNLKDELESATMSDFNQNVKKYHTWFNDKRKMIIKNEQGQDTYKEYVRCLFKTYKTSNIEVFRKAVMDERTKWVTGNQPKKYSQKELMLFASKLYLNIEKDDDPPTSTTLPTSDPGIEAKMLALIAQGESFFKSKDREGVKKEGETDVSWRYKNPSNLQTMNRKNKQGRDVAFKWCSNDCHTRHMWCARKNCLNRSAYAEMRNKKRETDSSEAAAPNQVPSKPKMSEDFKVALCAMIGEDACDQFTTQFFQ